MEDQKSRADRARCLIDMVIGKGERASHIMIDCMKKRDMDLCITLGLISSPAGDLKAEVKLKRLFSRARDKKTRFAGQDLSDKQLLQVAETLGQEWEQAAIHLELSITDLDVVKADGQTDVAMQKLKMLRLWRRRRPPGEATAQDLLRVLEDLEDLPVGTRLLLEGFGRSQESFSRKERPGLMSPSLPLEMHEGDSELDLLSKVERCHIDASAEIDEDDKVDEEEMHFKSHCEKCEAAQQSPEYEKVTPTQISKWSFQVQLKGKGTYECSATGLVFEVSEQALVRYSVLSWFQFSEFLKDSWRPAGSVYDVDVVNKDPSVLKFIHFPHSLCLAEPVRDLSFSVLHVKERHADIESTVDVKERHADIESTVGFTASHVKWRVSSLSLLGLILRSIRSIYLWMVEQHAMVLIYKELNKKDFIFQVYLGSNSLSELKVQAFSCRRRDISPIFTSPLSGASAQDPALQLPPVNHSLQAKQHPAPHPALQLPPVNHSLQAKQHPAPHPALQLPPVNHSLQAKQHPAPHPALQLPPVNHSLQAKQHPAPHPALQLPPVNHSLQAKQHPAPHPALQLPPVNHSLQAKQHPAPHPALQLPPGQHRQKVS
ncbi:unnamed protein product [Arctogadus glacialis]